MGVRVKDLGSQDHFVERRGDEAREPDHVRVDLNRLSESVRQRVWGVCVSVWSLCPRGCGGCASEGVGVEGVCQRVWRVCAIGCGGCAQ